MPDEVGGVKVSVSSEPSGDRDADGTAEREEAPYGGAFGLSREPFGTDPEPDFFCANRANRHVRKFLQMAIAELTPITLLLGPEGSGKTALVQRLLRAPTEGLQMGLIEASTGREGDLFERLLAAFDQEPPPAGRSGTRDAFLRFCVTGFEKGRVSLLIVDGAHGMSVADLVTLRHLISVRPGMTCPLILLLTGRPELGERLEEAELDGRVGASVSLPAMARDDTAGYVRHRLTVAGGSTHLFDDGAIEIIHRRSDGLPGRVNALCDLCLDVAARAGAGRVDASLAAAVPDDEASMVDPGLPPTPPRRPREEPRDEAPVRPPEVAQKAKTERIGPAPPNRGTAPAREAEGGTSDRRGANVPTSGVERVASRPEKPKPEKRPDETATPSGPDPSEPNPVVENLRAIPGYLAAVTVGGRDGPILDRRRGAERVEPALALAMACLTGAPTTLTASSGDAVCLVDPTRGVAVAGGRGLNLGFVRRAIRDLPTRPPTSSWSPDAPAIFAVPWRTALWRIVQVVDRTVSPRRLTLNPTEMAPLLVCDGRVGVPDGDLRAIGTALRAAAEASEGSLRYALAPSDETPGPSESALDLLVEAGGIERVEAAEVVLDVQGWPLAIPRGLGVPALSLAMGIARRVAGAGDRSHVAALGGAFQQRVAWWGDRDAIEIDAGWLTAQVDVNPFGMDTPSALGETGRPEVREVADG